MKYSILIFIIVPLVILSGCAKDSERQVKYLITDSVSGFTVRYLDESGQIITDMITTQSAEDKWTHEYSANDGDIVFVSANYKDPLSAIKVQIYIDGKVYKQAVSKQDTISFITVSGVVPIRE
jgi:predicted secreted Zn-dependent protease